MSPKVQKGKEFEVYNRLCLGSEELADIGAVTFGARGESEYVREDEFLLLSRT
jgi:hypothetical protein